MPQKPLSYVLQPEGRKEKKGSYVKAELDLMTTFHLREICRREKIIHAAMDTMDKEELIRIIMRFRGAEDHLLIKKPLEGGRERIIDFMKKTKLVSMQHQITAPARIVAWKGLDTVWKDSFGVRYQENIVGTNALIIADNRTICAIMNVEKIGDKLFLTRSGELPCEEAISKNYSVYLFGREYSDVIYHLYYGDEHIATPLLEIYNIPILDFVVREPVQANLPLAIDFGTSGTAAGTFVDPAFYESIETGLIPGQLKPEQINYVEYLRDANISDVSVPVIPTVVGVKNIDPITSEITYVYGEEAQKLARLSYIDEGFCVFYDIKRWISDYETLEELTDLQGRRLFIKRKDIMKSFLEYVINEAKQQFKCEFETIYMSCPVKQKKRFIDFYHDVLGKYSVETKDILDEGVSVLYSTIRNMIDQEKYEEGAEYKALIIDCGGGTTDLSSCTFSIENLRVSYNIQVETAYENGDTNFGGNNLTFRLMQFLKIVLANMLSPRSCMDHGDITASFPEDLFRFVDRYGVQEVYSTLEREYAKAEKVLPTRFKDYEQRDRKEYYKVKNNYYFLFETAERLKKQFFGQKDLLSLILSAEREGEGILPIDKWKISVLKNGNLQTLKTFPELELSIYEVQQVVRPNIYGIIRQFMERLYNDDELSEYNIIKMTGQSCKINLFRDCLKEFVPGKMIQFNEAGKTKKEDYTLKLTCLDGSIKYMMDKKFGYAKVSLHQELPNLPYDLTGFTHSGREVTLIHSLDRNNTAGVISRTLESIALQLTLKDVEKNSQYRYTITTDPEIAIPVTYEEIAENYSMEIPQDDVDTIQNGEVKYFIWSEPGYWGFNVLPVLRENEQLELGTEQFIAFENDHWVSNYFDGTR